MTKEECIQQKWEEAGFSWDQIKDIVDHEGGLMLDHPSLKTTIIGYQDAHKKGLLKGYDFNGSRLKVWNSLLDEIHRNYGWTKIESEADLPKQATWYITINKNGGYINSSIIFNAQSKDTWMRTYSHWRPIVEIPKPLY